MEPIKTQDCYLPVTDNAEGLFVWKEWEVITAVERRTDSYVFTKEELEKVITKAIQLGRQREKSGVTAKVDINKFFHTLA